MYGMPLLVPGLGCPEIMKMLSGVPSSMMTGTAIKSKECDGFHWRWWLLLTASGTWLLELGLHRTLPRPLRCDYGSLESLHFK